MSASSISTAALFLLPTMACAGSIVDDDATYAGGSPAPGLQSGEGGGALIPGLPGAGGSSGSIGSIGSTAACKTSIIDASGLRRLTALEYNNTVRDLLGVTDKPADVFPVDVRTLGFDHFPAAQSPSRVLVELYDTSAARIAAAAAVNLPKLLACNPGTDGEDACAQRFIAAFGRRAFRRPMTDGADGDKSRYFGFYAMAKARYGFADAVEILLTAMLQAPDFLYRPEIGAPGSQANGSIRLTGYELASRLSYFIWASTPDDQLLDAAGAGQLATAGQVAAQAERLLADPKARASIQHFHDQWLDLQAIHGLQKDPKLFPTFTPALRRLLRTEIEAFVENGVFSGDGSFATMLVADSTYMNKALSNHYGVVGPQGSAFERVRFAAGDARLGLLGLGGVMATHALAEQTHPVERGKFIREQVLCQHPPSPPDDADVQIPAVKPGQTTRQRFAAHVANPACAGCHRMLDPVGFGLENIDAVGRWRNTDQGLPIDAKGEVFGTDDADGPFEGQGALAVRLAASKQVSACAVKQWFRFAYARDAGQGDACFLGGLESAFRASGGNLRTLVVALTQTDAFLRTGLAGGAR